MVRTERIGHAPSYGTAETSHPRAARQALSEHNLVESDLDPWAALGFPHLSDIIRRICNLCGWAQAREGLGRTLAVTSALEGEGKSSLASALAIATAYDNAGSVLLLECDLFGPRASHDFGLGEGPGLADVIIGDEELFDAVQPTRIPNLRVLPAGHAYDNPSRLIRSSAMEDIVAEVRKHFAFIIMDLPAVLKTGCAPVLAQLAEATVLVVRSGATDQRDVQRAIGDLSQAELKGVILNRWRPAVPGLIRALLDQ